VKPRASPELRVPVREEADVAMARKSARELAVSQGFGEGAVGAIATAVSEVARNIVVHARGGEVVLSVVTETGRRGIMVVARDEAPGIPDVELAMRDGYSTAGSLGLGLASAKRLMDFFVVESARGKGTTVTMKKWEHGHR
jgi:serine/threonine-protein kinase RsbT